jgi:hypothetical protein
VISVIVFACGAEDFKGIGAIPVHADVCVDIDLVKGFFLFFVLLTD